MITLGRDVGNGNETCGKDRGGGRPYLALFGIRSGWFFSSSVAGGEIMRSA